MLDRESPTACMRQSTSDSFFVRREGGNDALLVQCQFLTKDGTAAERKAWTLFRICLCENLHCGKIEL